MLEVKKTSVVAFASAPSAVTADKAQIWDRSSSCSCLIIIPLLALMTG
jgi:hypothetical protein